MIPMYSSVSRGVFGVTGNTPSASLGLSPRDGATVDTVGVREKMHERSLGKWMNKR